MNQMMKIQNLMNILKKIKKLFLKKIQNIQIIRKNKILILLFPIIPKNPINFNLITKFSKIHKKMYKKRILSFLNKKYLKIKNNFLKNFSVWNMKLTLIMEIKMIFNKFNKKVK